MRMRLFELKTASVGGVTPKGADLEKARKADLITLPLEVVGTNCGNCKFVAQQSGGKLHCEHDKVNQTVTARMCCAYWDHQSVERPWLD